MDLSQQILKAVLWHELLRGCPPQVANSHSWQPPAGSACCSSTSAARNLRAWLLALPDPRAHLKRSTGNLAVPFRRSYPFEGMGWGWEPHAVMEMRMLGTQKGSLLEFLLRHLRSLQKPSANSKWSKCLPNGSPLPVHKYLHLWHSRSPSASDW